MNRCTVWYHLYNFKKVKNTYGGMLLLVKLQVSACNFKSNTSPWVFSRFLKLYKWSQIEQSITYVAHIGCHFERYFSHYRKHYLIKHTCWWCDKLIILRTLTRQAKIFLRKYKRIWNVTQASNEIFKDTLKACFC